MEEQGYELSINDMLNALKRKLVWITIIPVIVAVVVGVYVKYFTVDLYTAQVKLYTMFEYLDTYGMVQFDISDANNFMQDYKEFLKIDAVTRETSDRLGWEKWRSDVTINVSPISDTRLMNLSVTSPDPQLSADTANTLAAVFVEYARNLMQRDSIRIASQAMVGNIPANSNREILTLYAFIGAMVAVMGIIIGLEMLNTKVRADGSADVRLHVNVLSSITGYKKDMASYLKQGHVREGNMLDAMNEYTQESIKKLALNIEFAAMGSPLDTLTVTSTTPMEGKSSIALMLACEMAAQGKQVLIVDMDYRSPMIGRYLGRRNKKDIMDYMNGSASLQEVVSRTSTPNLFFMDSNHRIAVNAALPAFDRFVKECKQYFDLVVFDTPPLGMFIDAASLAAKTDGTVVIVADGRVEQKDLAKVIDQLNQVKARVLGIAYNFVQRREKGSYYNKYYKYGSHHRNERAATKGFRHDEIEENETLEETEA